MQAIREAPVVEPRHIERKARDQGPAGRAAVEVLELTHCFGELGVLERLTFELAPGEMLGIVGPSGCGKSTLLELIAGLAGTNSGRIRVDHALEPEARLGLCAYMPQRDLLLPWLSALDNAALAPRNRGASRASARAEALPLFERFGLAGFETSRPTELSGGMRQRVAFLRTLLAGKPVLLLDEPFASLDAITRAEMQEWLAGALAVERRSVVLVSHDIEEALYLADRVLVLSRRPARILAELRAPSPRRLPRAEVVTSGAFTAARERALAVLTEDR